MREPDFEGLKQKEVESALVNVRLDDGIRRREISQVAEVLFPSSLVRSPAPPRP